MRLLLLGFCLVLGCLAAVQQQRPQPAKVRAVGRPIVKLGAVTHRPLRPRVMRDWRTHDWRIPTTPNPLKNAWDKLLNSRTTTLSPVYPPWMTVATTPWPTPFKGFGSTQPPRGPGIFTAPALPTTKRPANGGAAAGGGGLIVFPTTPRHIATRKPFFTTTPRPRLPNNVPEFTDAPLDYCEYFASLGIDKPECRPPVAPEPEYGTCHRKFLLKTCKQNSACPQSGLLCMDVMSESCCAPPADQCPTPEQLGINCLKAKPTNWCTENYHCAGAQKLCCPTGCNYNICI